MKELNKSDIKVAITKLNKSEKLGIENIKKMFLIILTISASIVKLSKKFNYRILIELGLEIVSYGNIVDVFKESLKEFRDLDPQEAKQVALDAKRKFDIEDDELEARIEKGIDIIEEGFQIIPQAIKWGLEGYDWATSWKKVA